MLSKDRATTPFVADDLPPLQPTRHFGALEEDEPQKNLNQMDELVKALRYYVARDLVFLVSGGSVVVTFLYVFLPTAHHDKWPTISYALAAGIAYVVGYAVQDICSVIRIVTTAPVREPCCALQCVYRRFMRTPWQPLREMQSMDFLYRQQDGWDRASAKGKAPAYERLIMLLQFGTSGGPCALVCAGFLAWKARCSSLPFDIALAAGAAILGVSLLILGWLKAAQMTQLLKDPPPS